MRYIAPAGTPIGTRDLGSWVYNLVASNNIISRFEKEICNRYGVKYCFFVSTGRAALVLLLRSLSELAGETRNEVVIPSYTCFSVPSSIIKAGLRIRICDIDINTLDYDLQRLSKIDFSNVLCIVTANLYGIPNDLTQLVNIAKEHGVFLIDDAAQCMEGRVDDKFSGTFGDAGLFSLDKGKNITSIDGGIIVTNSDAVGLSIKSRVDTLPGPTKSKVFADILKLLFYVTFLHPKLYWIPNNLPFLNLGTTIYTTEYPIESYCSMLGAIGYRLFQRIEEITRVRIENGQYLSENLSNLPEIKFVRYSDRISPVYLRFPILIKNRDLREEIVMALNQVGIGASKSFPTSIVDIKEINENLSSQESEAEYGRLVADQIVTLPTHPYVAKGDLEKVVFTIKQAI